MVHFSERVYKEQAALMAESFAAHFEAGEVNVADLLEMLESEYDRDPDRTLDVACGTGRHVLALADRGCEAEGLDFSAEFLERARERAADSELAESTTFHHQDMRELDEWVAESVEAGESRAGAYDLVVNCWNSVGHYDRETDVAVFRAIRRLLADEGVFVVEMGNKDFFVAEGDRAYVQEQDDLFGVVRREYDVATGRFHFTQDLFDVTDDGYEYLDTMEFHYRNYAPVVLRELCLDAGFDDVDLYGDFDGSDLTQDSSRVVVVAR